MHLPTEPLAPAGVTASDWTGAAHLPESRPVKRILVILAIGIVVLGCLREWLRLGYGVEGTSFFSLNREQNIGAWFSTILLAGCALLLMACGRRAVSAGQRIGWFWFVLSLTFVALSIDEASSIHESLMEPIHDALHSDGVLKYAWVVPALVLVPAFALASIPFLRSLPVRTALRFMVAGALYVSGALGFEMLEGLTDGVGWVFVTFYIVEEALEITGILLFLFALMDYLGAPAPSRRISPPSA